MGLPGWSLDEPTVIGDLTLLPRGYRWPSDSIGRERSAIVNETTGGVRYGYNLFHRDKAEYIFRFPFEERSAFQAISEATFGRVLPFYFVPDSEDMNTVLYCRLLDDHFEPKNTGQPGAFNGTMQPWFDWTMRVSAEVIPLEVGD